MCVCACVCVCVCVCVLGGVRQLPRGELSCPGWGGLKSLAEARKRGADESAHLWGETRLGVDVWFMVQG